MVYKLHPNKVYVKKCITERTVNLSKVTWLLGDSMKIRTKAV